MPLTINVGLSRKLSQDFNSVGVSINVTAELDQGLLVRAQELQRQIGELYQQANEALDRQLATTVPPERYAAPGEGRRPAANNENRRYEPNGRFRGNYSGNGGSRNGNGRSPAPMTAKQRSAILAIARACEVDAFGTARQTFDTDLDSLTARQASALIDSLKESRPTAR